MYNYSADLLLKILIIAGLKDANVNYVKKIIFNCSVEIEALAQQLKWKFASTPADFLPEVPVGFGHAAEHAHSRLTFPPTRSRATSADSVGVVYSKTTRAPVKLQK